MITAVIILSVFTVTGWGLLAAFLVRLRQKRNRQQSASSELTEWDRKFMAVHEAGHAVVQMELFGADSIKCITIQPSTIAFGCMQLRENPNHNQTRNALINEMAVALAGRLAEEMILNETTTSMIHDLQKVRFLAKNMITEWAMGNRQRYLEFDPAFATETRKQQIETETDLLFREAEGKAKNI